MEPTPQEKTLVLVCLDCFGEIEEFRAKREVSQVVAGAFQSKRAGDGADTGCDALKVRVAGLPEQTRP